MDYETFNKGCLEEAKRLYKTANTDQRYVLEKLFPELRETEDEKIRKNLINFLDAVWHLGKNANFDEHSKADCAEWISWLEKQEGCELIRKEWLEHIKQSWYKEGFIYGKYGGGTSKEWTINDTTTLNELIDFLENGTAKLQHDLTLYANWLKTQFPPNEKQGENKPIIEMITPEESLGIDSETYKKIVDECIYGDDKQNPAWGEEDECYMSECIVAIATKDGWSFEEKRKTKHWLKSLKDRYTWKPSDEQMDALYTYIYNPQYFNTPDPRMELVISVYEDLKKLKGE